MESGLAYWQKGYIIIKSDVEPNLDHIATINGGKIQGVPVRFEFVDPRMVNPKQRKLFFALLGDIINWSGESKEMVKNYFYNKYWVDTEGQEISLAHDSTNTVSDAKKLIDMVIDTIFANQVPVKKGYELLPRNEEHFQYKCLMNRQCLICGQHADIHHIDEIGMGRDRNKVDHTKHHLMALCRAHHTEYHKIGPIAFGNKYHISTAGIKLNADELKKIGVRGDYGKD